MTLDRNAEKQEVPIDPKTGKPYINTLAAVAISPAGASPEKSTYVAQAVDVIRQSGLPNETNAMFTNIEGDIDDVLKVIRDATMKLAGQGYRTDVVIRLDIRPGFNGQIHAKQDLVDEILSEWRVPRITASGGARRSHCSCANDAPSRFSQVSSSTGIGLQL